MAKKSEIPKTDPKVIRSWLPDKDLDRVCQAWSDYQGQLEVFESAVGAFFFGRIAGYDALRIVHSWRTLRKYEQILGVSFKEVLPARTPESRRVNGIRLADGFKQFWKALGAGVASEPGAKEAVKA